MFSAVNTRAIDAQAQLRAIASDASRAAIVRATALAQLNHSDSQLVVETLAESSRDRNPLLRLAALQSLTNAPLAARVSLAAPLAYVYAVALHSSGRAEEAIARLKKAIQTSPSDRDMLEALVSFHKERGEGGAAKKYADSLQVLLEADKR
jgi:tetratricopeptide (TPR) repeat protein